MHQEYNRNHVLSECTDIILEAKRVLLNEDIDKMASITLSDGMGFTTKQCKQTLNWNDASFWEHLPNPKNNSDKAKTKNEDIQFSISQNTKILLNKINDLQNRAKSALKPKSDTKRDRDILKSHFQKWRLITLRSKEKIKQEKEALLKQEKLEMFLKNYAKCKKIQEKQKRNTQSAKQLKQNNLEHDNLSVNHSSDPSHGKYPSNLSRKVNLKIVDDASYKNRFKAQRKIIDVQKEKLDAQNKVIEELRLGIIKEELMKSLDCAKVDIREIFSKCSAKVKLKIMPQLELIEAEREAFFVSTQKAPKIVQKMEERAMERALKREIILERKRIIEEQKKRLAEETIEKKRMQDEEERKRNMEVLKERRRKELELERIRQANKQKFIVKWNISCDHYDKKLLKNNFETLKEYYFASKQNKYKSENHFHSKILQKAMQMWKDLIEDKYKLKYEVADKLHNKKILKYYFIRWKEIRIERIQSMQVAEDLYDLHLQNNIFVHWHRYVCAEIVLTEKKMLKATAHYKRRILFQCFYQWRSLPAVLQLEKAKEEKKRKWRAKVWEILPDYRPPTDD